MKVLLRQTCGSSVIVMIMLIHLIGFVKNDTSVFSSSSSGNINNVNNINHQKAIASGINNLGGGGVEGIETIIKNKDETITSVDKSASTTKCQEITIPMCKGIGYNYTEMPNPFNHDSQEEAGMEVHQYWPLVEIKCSSDLKFFICSLYVPICMEDYVGIVPPCRTVCERAKHGCEPVMVQYGFPWPERMQCDRFPKYGKGNICMDERNGEPPPPNRPLQPTTTPLAFPMPPPCICSCKSPLVKINNNNSIVQYTTNAIPNCAIPCDGDYKSPEETSFSTWWLSLWSGLCCITTFITLLTFLIDTDRFKYPERPIVYLSACYMMVSCGYLIRIWRGHDEIACNDDGIVRYGVQIGKTYTEADQGNIWCVLVFLFVYYFGMASSFWWVILTLTWYLAAGLKWSTEAITSHSHVFHVISWVLPAIGTLVAIIDGAIDGDAIAGICSIGNQDAVRLIIYIVGPLGILLIVGTGFLMAGFISLVRIREVIASQGGRSKAEKLEKLMMRIGIFSVLYTLPASAVIAAYFYEISAKALWLESITCSCKTGTKVEKPLYSVLMLKYFMSLAVGITSGVWIWSGKTVESWQRFFRINNSNNNRNKYTAAIQQQQQQAQRISGPSFNPMGSGSGIVKCPSHV